MPIERKGTSEWSRYGDIFRCTVDDPYSQAKWPKGSGRVLHDAAVEVADNDETRDMQCGNCGTSWTEELPQ